jgi:KaiC/GvpD/RAD55 family RecA-like ATPase
LSDQPDVSKAQLYVDQKAWNWRRASSNQINVESCPLPECGNSNWKFFINSDNGCWDCKVCGKEGNLHQLMQTLGDRMESLISMQDLARSNQAPESLPNMEKLHEQLMQDEEAMPYLMEERGWTYETIVALKLGMDNRDGKKWVVYPYYQHDQLVFAKWRTLPPFEKDFRSVTGRDTPLFNDNAIVKDMEELWIVEGEADAISLYNIGITNVVGVPGAGMKKAPWITKLDNAKPKKMYLLYDNDTAGQDGAREFAIRFGIDRFNNIVLPQFQTANGKEGKDITEWLKAGHTLDELRTLAAAAHPFDVPGVQNVSTLLDELRKHITEKGTLVPRYVTQWPSLNAKFGGANDGMLVGVVADAKIGKTTLVMNWLWWLVRELKEVGLLYCLEMSNQEMTKKLVSHDQQVDLSPYRGKDPIEKSAYDKKQAEELLAGIDNMVAKLPTIGGDLLFGHNTASSAEEVFDTIRNAVRRYGCKVVAFDNLHLLADSTLRSLGHRTAYLSQLSKKFLSLAKELNILIILIMQPNRGQEGEMTRARNVDGSSAMEKDVDAMLCLNRVREGKVRMNDLELIGDLDVAENFGPKLYVRVDLSRYAPGGVCTLHMDGGRSTVSEMFAEDPLPKMSVPVEVGVPAAQSVQAEQFVEA